MLSLIFFILSRDFEAATAPIVFSFHGHAYIHTLSHTLWFSATFFVFSLVLFLRAVSELFCNRKLWPPICMWGISSGNGLICLERWAGTKGCKTDCGRFLSGAFACEVTHSAVMRWRYCRRPDCRESSLGSPWTQVGWVWGWLLVQLLGKTRAPFVLLWRLV